MIIRLNHITLIMMLFLSVSIGFSSPVSQPLAGGYEPHSGQSIFDLLHHQEVVNITLVGELDSLINVRNTNDYNHAQLTYTDQAGVNRNYQIKVKPRGKFRRRVCDFPPLKLKFSKDELEAAGLSEHNDLKLVTHCMDDKEYSESLILKEYLAYKMYNELTPNSFRVQLVNITYRDKHDASKSITQFGFLIEDVDEMAERIGGKECDDCMGIETNKVDKAQENIMAMFQYMIGNHDYSILMNRNVKLIEVKDGEYIPVPYDFDYSNLVEAPYQKANPELGQSAAKERVFIGSAKDGKELYSTMAYFRTKKDALIRVIRDFDLLDKTERYQIEAYVRSFFDGLRPKSDDGGLNFGPMLQEGR